MNSSFEHVATCFILFHYLCRLINEPDFIFVNTFLVMLKDVPNTDVWHCILGLVCSALITVVEICRSFLCGRFQPLEGHMRYRILLCVTGKETPFSGQPLAVNVLARIHPAWCDIFNK